MQQSVDECKSLRYHIRIPWASGCQDQPYPLFNKKDNEWEKNFNQGKVWNSLLRWHIWLFVLDYVNTLDVSTIPKSISSLSPP